MIDLMVELSGRTWSCHLWDSHYGALERSLRFVYYLAVPGSELVSGNQSAAEAGRPLSVESRWSLY